MSESRALLAVDNPSTGIVKSNVSQNPGFSCTRRLFLARAAALSAGAVLSRIPSARADTVAAAEAGSSAELVDTHTHFYDPSRPQGVPWPPKEDELLFRTVLPKDYRRIKLPSPVTGTVVVEASPWTEDNQWVLDLAAAEPFILGVVGNLPIGTPAFPELLKRFAANPLFRGIRVRDRKLEELVSESIFQQHLRLLVNRNLSVDLVGGLEILGFATKVAKQIPDLRIVIDHLAGVRVNGSQPPMEWRQGMSELAKAPNVFCKVSGLVEGTGKSHGTAPGDPATYKPVLDAMRGMFGTHRLLYGSNWPVSERFAPLATVQNIVGSYFSSPSERHDVFVATSRRVYQWTPRK